MKNLILIVVFALIAATPYLIYSNSLHTNLFDSLASVSNFPLPSAGILFVVALVGVAFLGRRRPTFSN